MRNRARKNKLSILVLFLLGISQLSYSQDDERVFQASLYGSHFLAGELNSIYNLTAGAEVLYFFSHKPKFHHFLNSGFITDIGTKGANLYAFDLGVGTQYDIAKLWSKPLFLQASIGGLYWQEKFSTQLTGKTVNSSISEFGFKASLGIGYRLSKRLSIQLNATQFSTKGSSIGLGLSYSL